MFEGRFELSPLALAENEVRCRCPDAKGGDTNTARKLEMASQVEMV